MSHFTVLVTPDNEDDLERILLPFYEQFDQGDQEAIENGWIEYHDQEEGFLDEYNSDSTDVVRLANGIIKLRHDKIFRDSDYYSRPIGDNSSGYTYPEDAELLELPFNQIYSTFEEFVKDWHGYNPDEPLGYWHNPNARWDWWQIGGRWPNSLSLNTAGMDAVIANDPDAPGKGDPSFLWKKEQLDELHADLTSGCAALVKHIDWDSMLAEDLEYREGRWDKYHSALEEAQGFSDPPSIAAALIKEGSRDNPVKEILEEWNTQYNQDGHRGEQIRDIFPTLHLFAEDKLVDEILRERYDIWSITETWDDLRAIRSPKDEYMQLHSGKAQTFAFIDLEGNWVERGNMGWWGTVSNRQKGYDEAWWTFVRSLDDDQLVVVLDCHI